MVLWDMADRATDLTLNERRAMKGYEPVDGGDTVLVNSSQISLSMAVSPIQDEPLSSVDDVKALAYGQKAN
jgi:hypothetical protein